MFDEVNININITLDLGAVLVLCVLVLIMILRYSPKSNDRVARKASPSVALLDCIPFIRSNISRMGRPRLDKPRSDDVDDPDRVDTPR